MSMFDSILSQLGAAAKNLATHIIPGADNLVAAGKSIVAAFETVKAQNGGTAPAQAEADHDALLAKVKAHADRTLTRLERG
jgi:hypothetical protein